MAVKEDENGSKKRSKRKEEKREVGDIVKTPLSALWLYGLIAFIHINDAVMQASICRSAHARVTAEPATGRMEIGGVKEADGCCARAPSLPSPAAAAVLAVLMGIMTLSDSGVRLTWE